MNHASVFGNWSNGSCDIATCPKPPSSFWFIVQTLLLLITCLISIPSNMLVVVGLRASSSVHSNVRLLLINLGIAHVLLSSHYAGQSIYNFVLYADIASFDSYDTLALTKFHCSLYQLINVITVQVVVFLLTCIVIERLLVITVYQSLLSVDSDKSNARVRMFAASCWLLAIAFVLPYFIELNDSCLCYCHSVLVSTPASFYVVLSVSLAGEFLSVIICIVVRRLSVKILANAHNHTSNTNAMNSLTERYQLIKNVNTMSMLYPTILVHCLFFILAMILRVPAHLWLSSDTVISYDTSAAILHLLLVNMQFVVAVNFLHPILIVRNNPRLAVVISEKQPTLTKILFAINPKSATIEAAISTITATLNKAAAANLNSNSPKTSGRGTKQEPGQKKTGMWTEYDKTNNESIQTAEKHRKISNAVTGKNRLVTEFRQAAGAHEMVWENYWKK